MLEKVERGETPAPLSTRHALASRGLIEGTEADAQRRTRPRRTAAASGPRDRRISLVAAGRGVAGTRERLGESNARRSKGESRKVAAEPFTYTGSVAGVTIQHNVQIFPWVVRASNTRTQPFNGCFIHISLAANAVASARNPDKPTGAASCGDPSSKNSGRHASPRRAWRIHLLSMCCGVYPDSFSAALSPSINR